MSGLFSWWHWITKKLSPSTVYIDFADTPIATIADENTARAMALIQDGRRVAQIENIPLRYKRLELILPAKPVTAVLTIYRDRTHSSHNVVVLRVKGMVGYGVIEIAWLDFGISSYVEYCARNFRETAAAYGVCNSTTLANMLCCLSNASGIPLSGDLSSDPPQVICHGPFEHRTGVTIAFRDKNGGDYILTYDNASSSEEKDS